MKPLPERPLLSCAELIDFINEVGILPLLRNGMNWSAQEAVDPVCDYQEPVDGGTGWPLWDWKGDIIKQTGCAYGSFINGNATFITQQFWADFCNYRRSVMPKPEPDSVEAMILEVLDRNGSMITRDLRSICGFDTPKLRSKFSKYITRLNMSCRIVTEDFVYPVDKKGKRYGWGWALHTRPERLFGADACTTSHTPEQSYQRLREHLEQLFPDSDETFFRYLLK